jgi:hypothetical protein
MSKLCAAENVRDCHMQISAPERVTKQRQKSHHYERSTQEAVCYYYGTHFVRLKSYVGST